MTKEKRPLPELLAPAGDMDALVSALASGADAVYFGTDLFNARIRACNFTLEQAREAIRLCHAHGKRAYVTLNIEIYEREIPLVLEYVSSLYESGVDALIVADFGIMALLREHFPDLDIHASTQASAHNLDGVKALEELGCTRVVVARELDRENLSLICRHAEAEIEMFVHGAHCVSMSGQCLMSYAMGGRSGNRGECAQPCRLPYRIECGVRNAECGMVGAEFGCRASSTYPLSLKDMSLANRIPEIIDTGAASLKIEGRMKSAEYVGGVVSVWRELLDSRRSATASQMDALGALFSRQGFTQGYFDNRVDGAMLGIRSEGDKATTREQVLEPKALQKPKIDIFARFVEGERALLTVTQGEKSVTVYGDIVERAIKAPMSEDDLKKSLLKLGSTPYQAGSITIEKSDSVMVRVSSLNALRRQAVDMLLGARNPKKADYVSKKRPKGDKRLRSAVFSTDAQIPDNAAEFFDRIYVPVYYYDSACGANGVYLPPIILDSEWNDVEALLKRAKECGAKYALATNIGQIRVLKRMGFIVACDFRFNVFNTYTANYLCSFSVENIILCPELSLPQARDMADCSLIAYGKFPVMTTFKCICKTADSCTKMCEGYLTDRTGAKMFYEAIYGHRTVIYNSVPVYMADKAELIEGFSWHFIFTDEKKEECSQIIEAYRNKEPTTKKIRRISK